VIAYNVAQHGGPIAIVVIASIIAVHLATLAGGLLYARYGNPTAVADGEEFSVKLEGLHAEYAALVDEHAALTAKLCEQIETNSKLVMQSEMDNKLIAAMEVSAGGGRSTGHTFNGLAAAA
jgi:hypothetical protein